MKRVISLLLVLVMLVGFLPVVSVQAAPAATVSATPDGTENWSDLRLNLGGPENSRQGFMGTPLGNGQFAARENGGVALDIIQLNHNTFWTGDPKKVMDGFNGVPGGNTPQVKREAYQRLKAHLRAAYQEGINLETRERELFAFNEEIKNLCGGAKGEEQGALLCLGSLDLSFPEFEGKRESDYSRILDLDRATSEITFTVDGVRYKRETFISHPDNVMVMKITNDQNRNMDMNMAFSWPQDKHNTYYPDPKDGKAPADNKIFVDQEKQELVLQGRAPILNRKDWQDGRGTKYEARAKVLAPSGTVQINDNRISVNGANEIVVLYSCDTSYVDAFTDPYQNEKDYQGNIRKALDYATKTAYETLLETHLQDYRSLFRRLWFDMDGTAVNNAMPRDFAMHYQYGRYISICLEREDTMLPHANRGMWKYNSGNNGGAYYLNENLQKMEAILGPGNLANASKALFRFADLMSHSGSTGQLTAQDTYGAEDGAWMSSHSLGSWGTTGMGGGNPWGPWLAGGMWAMDPLYDLYDFTRDISVLEEIYPILVGAAKFALSTMEEIPGVNGELKGYLSILPAGSPEHWYKVNGRNLSFDINTACDVAIYHNLFNMVLEGAEDLQKAGKNVDTSFVARVKEANDKLVPLNVLIKEDGRIHEWYNDYPVGQENHRHCSQLVGLYLNHLHYNPVEDPEVYAALQKETERWRSVTMGEHPDKAMITLRAGDPEFAMSHLTHGVVTKFRHHDVMQYTPVAASIVETILDSRFGQLNLMECMPAAWTSGTIKGLCGRGGYELGITWENGELVHCTIKSNTGETPRVLYKGFPVNLAEDPRFTVEYAKEPSAEQLKMEAAEKLEGRYTEASKQMLQEALTSGDRNKISEALLAMVPEWYGDLTVTVKSSTNICVLTSVGETLRLEAACPVQSATFNWSVKAMEEGADISKIASVDENGVVTAVGSGKYQVIATLKSDPTIQGFLELRNEITSTGEEMVDDTDPRIKYVDVGDNSWQIDTAHSDKFYKGSQHQTKPAANNEGVYCELTFNGYGIAYFGGKGGNYGDAEIYIDGDPVATVDCYVPEAVYNQKLYETKELEPGEHTIKIVNKKHEGRSRHRLDVDAFKIYSKSGEITVHSELKKLYDKYSVLENNNTYTEESWNKLQAELQNAKTILGDLHAEESKVQKAVDDLKAAYDGLVLDLTTSTTSMHWKFENSLQAENNGPEGTMKDGTATYVPGRQDGELALRMSMEKDARVELPKDLPELKDQWTVNAWIKQDDANANYTFLLADKDGSLRPVQNASGGKIGFSTPGRDFTYDCKMPTNVWTMLTYTQSNGQVTLYVDGVKKETIEAQFKKLPMQMIGNCPQNWRIDGNLHADLDELLVLPTCLNDQQIKELHDNGTIPQDNVLNVKHVETLAPLTVDYGTKVEDIVLPQTVSVTLDNGKLAVVRVSWTGLPDTLPQEDSLELTGTLLVEGIVGNPGKLHATLTVNVTKCTHAQPAKHEGRPATCAEAGQKEYWECTKCHQYFEDAACSKVISDLESWITIAKLEHVWKEATYTWNTDNTSCTAERVCERDLSHKEAEQGTVKAEQTKAPTYEAEGEMIYTATFTADWAEEQIKTAVLAKLNVTYTEVPEKPATLEHEGTKAHFKGSDGKLYVKDVNGNMVEVHVSDLVIPKLEPEKPIEPDIPPVRPVEPGKPEVKPALPFADVSQNEWFYDSVYSAWENNLLDGMTDTEFAPNGTLTVAQTIKLAAALHQRDKLGAVTLRNGTEQWYSTYVDYAIANGVIEQAYTEYTPVQMNAPVTRREFVKILHGANDFYAEKNTVADNAIPDVKLTDKNGVEIYEFYRAGILTGSDEHGTFYPETSIKRSEAAAILVRMYDVTVRETIVLP